MNVKQLITLSALALVGTAALADDPTIVNNDFKSTLTRAEVRAELAKARADGSMAIVGEMGYIAPVTTSASTLTREQVRAEAIASMRGRKANRDEAA